MNELLLGAFMVGFLGSMHCVGMCGGLVTALSMSRTRLWWPGIVNYQVGRIATYTSLGLIIGILGVATTQIPWLSNPQQILAVIAGILMVVFGFNLAGWLPDPFVRNLAKITAAIGLTRWVHTASTSRMPMSWFMVGLFNGLLPCGLVYAGLALSLGSGDILLSASMMFAFGLGTVPAMTVIPWILKFASPSLRGKLLKIAAILLIGLGILTALRGGDWMHKMHEHPASTADATATHEHHMPITPSNQPTESMPMHHGH